MESHDSYPCFHTRLVRTQRRRLTRPDGSSGGWLIINADQLTEIFADVTDSLSGLAEASDLADAIGDDSPRMSIPRPR